MGAFAGIFKRFYFTPPPPPPILIPNYKILTFLRFIYLVIRYV
jgi:hypothetical protein